MLKELEFDEIQKFFEELDSKPNSKLQKAQLYGMALREQERRGQEANVEATMSQNYRYVRKTTVISKDMAIVEADTKINKESEILYYPVVNGRYVKQSFMSFDEALVYCLCKKYNQEYHAPSMIYNMLRMDLEVKK